MTSFYSYNPKLDGLKVTAKDARNRYTSFAASYAKINEEAARQMQKWAVQELNRHIRRHKEAQTGTLESAILDPGAISADVDAFRFLITEFMDKAVVNPARPNRGTYWRAIEYGSHHAIGFVLPLSFFDPNDFERPPNSRRAGKRLGKPAHGLPKGAFVGGLDRYEKHLGGFVTVKKPIRPYHYAQYAEDRFLAGDKAYYKGLIEAEVARLRLPAGKLKFNE